MSLTMGCHLIHHCWTSLPMPKDMINCINATIGHCTLAAQDLSFTWSDGTPILDPDNDDDAYNSSDYVPSKLADESDNNGADDDLLAARVDDGTDGINPDGDNNDDDDDGDDNEHEENDDDTIVDEGYDDESDDDEDKDDIDDDVPMVSDGKESIDNTGVVTEATKHENESVGTTGVPEKTVGITGVPGETAQDGSETPGVTGQGKEANDGTNSNDDPEDGGDDGAIMNE